jgi:hypothetical protein
LHISIAVVFAALFRGLGVLTLKYIKKLENNRSSAMFNALSKRGVVAEGVASS